MFHVKHLYAKYKLVAGKAGEALIDQQGPRCWKPAQPTEII